MHVLSLTLLASFLAPQDPRNATIQLPGAAGIVTAVIIWVRLACVCVCVELW